MPQIYVCEPCDAHGEVTAGSRYDAHADQIVCGEHAGDESSAYGCEFITSIPGSGDCRLFGRPTAEMPQQVYEQVWFAVAVNEDVDEL